MRKFVTGTAVGLTRTILTAAGHAAADLLSAAAYSATSVGNRLTGATSGPGTLRLTVLILSDENGEPLIQPHQLTPAIRLASAVFNSAGLRLRHIGTEVVAEPAPTKALDPRANRLLLLDQVLDRNWFYEQQMRAHPSTGAALDPVGRPITAIVVRDIAGRTTGCSLGISADWVIVQASLFDETDPQRYDETVLAHELGHACNLPHHRSRQNLMYPSSGPPANLRGVELAGWQSAMLRASRHSVPGSPVS